MPRAENPCATAGVCAAGAGDAGREGGAGPAVRVCVLHVHTRTHSRFRGRLSDDVLPAARALTSAKLSSRGSGDSVLAAVGAHCPLHQRVSESDR